MTRRMEGGEGKEPGWKGKGEEEEEELRERGGA